MEATYDKKTDMLTDTLTVTLKEIVVAGSDEDKPGITLDYDLKANLASVEVLDASRRVTEAGKVDFIAT